MIRTSTNRLAATSVAFIVAAILATAGGLATPSFGQSENELRRENQALRAEVQDLKSELAAQKRLIAKLEADLIAARNANQSTPPATGSGGTATGGSAGTTPPPADPVSIDESIPNASPRALFAALRKDYDDRMAEAEPGNVGDAKRIAYFRSLSNWIARANRAYRQRIEWHVKVIEGQQTRDGLMLRVIAVDPVHGTELGDPFETFLANRAAIVRFQKSITDIRTDTFVLKGVVVPGVRLNRDRAEVGAFNNPPLIGPWVEFIIAAEATSLAPPKPERDDDA